MGNIYIADTYNNYVRKLDPNGILTNFAGNGEVGYYGDGGPATKAALNSVAGLSTDRFGNVYIADVENCVIRTVNVQTTVISTFAGNGSCGFSGNGELAIHTELVETTGVAFQPRFIYVSDRYSIRQILVNSAGYHISFSLATVLFFIFFIFPF